MAIKRRIESEPRVSRISDSPEYGDDWLGDDTQFSKGGRQDVGLIYRGRGSTKISMGGRAPPVFIQSDRLPTLVPTLVPPPPPFVPPAPPVREPSQPEELQVIVNNPPPGGDPRGWIGNDADGNPIYRNPDAVVYGPTIIESEENPLSILGDLYDVVDTRLGGILPGGVPFGGVAPTPPFQQVVQTGVAPVAPAATVIPGTGGPVMVSADCAPTMIYNSKTGKWTRKRRRRRRQLATRSDIRDLSALKGVLGNGKALESWIATHA